MDFLRSVYSKMDTLPDTAPVTGSLNDKPFSPSQRRGGLKRTDIFTVASQLGFRNLVADHL